MADVRDQRIKRELGRIQKRIRVRGQEIEDLQKKPILDPEERVRLDASRKELQELQAEEMELFPELTEEERERASFFGKEVQEREVRMLPQISPRDAITHTIIVLAIVFVAFLSLWLLWSPFGDIRFGLTVGIGLAIMGIFLIIRNFKRVASAFFFVVGSEIPPRMGLVIRLGKVLGAAEEGTFGLFPFIDHVVKFKTSQIIMRYEIPEVISKAEGRQAAQSMPVRAVFSFSLPRPTRLYYMPLSDRYMWGSDLLNRFRRSLPWDPDKVDETLLGPHILGSIVGGIQNVMGERTHLYNRENRELVEAMVKRYVVSESGNILRELGIPPRLMDLELTEIGLPEETRQALRHTEIVKEEGDQGRIKAQAEADANVLRAKGERQAAPDRAKAVEELLKPYISEGSSRDLANMIVGGGIAGGEGGQRQGFNIDPMIQIMTLRSLGELSAGQTQRKQDSPFTVDELLKALETMTPTQRRLFESYFRQERRRRRQQ